MSKEKLLKIWKVTRTILIPLAIALAGVLFLGEGDDRPHLAHSSSTPYSAWMLMQPGPYWVLHLC